MKRFLYLFSGLALTCAAFSCKPTFEEPTTDAANLDFTKYVAVGDYNTAGFTNGGLSRASQENAYPAILAKQFASAGGPATFVQPYFTGSGTQMLTLSFSPTGAPIISGADELTKLLLSNCSGGTSSIYEHYSNTISDQVALQNMGVPGIKIMQLTTAGLGNETNKTNPANFNPYFERIMPANDNRSYYKAVNATKPTFFTMWLGMSDIVSYSLSGGTCGRMPTTTDFTIKVATMLDSLSLMTKTTVNNKTVYRSTRKGVICNLPLFFDFAFTRLADPLVLQKQYQTEKNDNNLRIWAKVIRVPNVPALGFDTLEVSEKEILTARALATIGKKINGDGTPSTLDHGLSKLNPLDNAEVLDRKETGDVDQLINGYNTAIENLLKGSTSSPSPYRDFVVLADMKQLFGTLRGGIIQNGVKYNLSPVRGGIFSLDNFSLTPRGQAIVANKIIQTMNQPTSTSPLATGFGTKLNEVDVNAYPALQLP